ncbi:MAG: hypothetical protein LBV58_04825 [Acholeplasmatales bacterium]|jgi:hypothetical protein|nr:hypothetical protein [Acholeplasmatales bacterium]
MAELELIVVVCNHGFADDVVASARHAGARGATILHGRGSATPEMTKFLGITIFPDKDLLLIVSKKEAKEIIMKTIMVDQGNEKDAHAICFSLPVSDALGLSFT